MLLPTPDSIPIAEGDDVSILDDTTTFERPIGRKAKKANRKKKASKKDVGEYLAKKMKCIKESQEQEKENLHIKAERVRLEELRDNDRVQLEERRILMEEEWINIEWESSVSKVW